MLLESLIHGLVARSIIDLPDALEIIAIATETQRQIDGETRHAGDPTASSVTLSEAISSSLGARFARLTATSQMSITRAPDSAAIYRTKD